MAYLETNVGQGSWKRFEVVKTFFGDQFFETDDFAYIALQIDMNTFLLHVLLRLYQTWANYGPQAKSDPPGLLFWPAGCYRHVARLITVKVQ